MKTLPDNDFDDLFRKRVDEFETGFDELAWNNMENRLRHRDRIVWVQRSSLLLLCLLFLGAGGYFLLKNEVQPVKYSKAKQARADKTDTVMPEIGTENAARPVFTDKNPENGPAVNQSQKVIESTAAAMASAEKNIPKKGIAASPERSVNKVGPSKETPENLALGTNNLQQKSIRPEAEKAPVNAGQEEAGQPARSLQKPYTAETAQKTTEILASDVQKTAVKKDRAEKKNIIKTASPVVWSFTFSAGPELSAVNKIGGSQAKLQLGVLVNAKISKRVTLSTGLRYGTKQYEASRFNYAFGVPRPWQSQISAIDASCNVMELPMRVSYALGNAGQSDFKINGGISSYFMLKEVYDFMYTPQSGIPRFYLTKNNANQHVLGVAEISATYTISPKNSPVQFGIEPYMKLPLAGVGEGKVKLNSTGISLNITYGLFKK